MKIKEISLKNFMKYDEVLCSLNEDVTYLVGKNGSGKSSLAIYGVQAILQGIAEKASGGTTPLYGERFRFIGPKGASSTNQLTLVDERRGNAEIKITRKITKSGSELSIVAPPDYGEDLDQAWLNRLFNIFLIAPKQFQLLSPKEQANALGIDTMPFDKEILRLKQDHTLINREIAAFGILEPLEEILEVDVRALEERKKTIREGMEKQYRANQATNKGVREAWEADKRRIDDEVSTFNNTLTVERRRRDGILDIADRIQVAAETLPVELEELVDYSQLLVHIRGWQKIEEPKEAASLYTAEPTNLADKPDEYIPGEEEKVYIRELPDRTALDAIDKEIGEAGETNKKALLYQQYLQKKEAKEAKEKELQSNKDAQAAKAEARLAYIKAFKFPFSNLTVDDDGQLLMNGRPIKEPHFSTGEMLKIIPILISTANPEMKYVFLQDFNLMDEDKQEDVVKYLTEKGFQLVIEYVGKEKMEDKACILLKDNVIVENYEEQQQPQLAL
jgi:hypothetical protein